MSTMGSLSSRSGRLLRQAAPNRRAALSETGAQAGRPTFPTRAWTAGGNPAGAPFQGWLALRMSILSHRAVPVATGQQTSRVDSNCAPFKSFFGWRSQFSNILTLPGGTSPKGEGPPSWLPDWPIIFESISTHGRWSLVRFWTSALTHTVTQFSSSGFDVARLQLSNCRISFAFADFSATISFGADGKGTLPRSIRSPRHAITCTCTWDFSGSRLEVSWNYNGSILPRQLIRPP